MMEVLFDLDMHINVLVGRFYIYYLFKLIIFFNLECSMIVHRRCRTKVGNYCGCKQDSFELYTQWKKTVKLFSY